MNSTGSGSETVVRHQVERLTEIGIALSAELRLDALLEKTLTYAREMTHADAGTLYLLRNGQLHFSILQNQSLGIFQGGVSGPPIELPPVDLKKENVSAYAALLGQIVRIDDVYASTQFDFSGPRRYDKQTGYRSRSMLVVPMKNHHGEVTGVLQLINCMDRTTGSVVHFSDKAVRLAHALASQAAVAITNAGLIDEIKNLFESLIRVLANAIDQKSPYTGNHVQRVAEFNVVLARAINEKKDGPFAQTEFTPEQLEEIRLAGWLHDVGKVTTPVHIMDKATKLEAIMDRIALIEARFDAIARGIALQAERRKCAALAGGAGAVDIERIDSDAQQATASLLDDLAFLRRCNQPGEFMEDDKIARVRQIAAKTYVDAEGAEKTYLTPDEVKNLSIRKGTLTDEEFQIMRDHVSMTERMLRQVPFAGRLKNVPQYASQHHEKLNGKGYPHGLNGANLPLQSRILAIADFYEALSARDRPYKKPMPEEMVLTILRRAADDGEIDADVLALLTQDGIHRTFEKEYAAAKTRTEGGTLKI